METNEKTKAIMAKMHDHKSYDMLDLYKKILEIYNLSIVEYMPSIGIGLRIVINEIEKVWENK